MTQHQQFLDHLLRESQRFRDVLAQASPATHVPTCPDWRADDLLWHLGEVQWFWGEIVEHRHTHREQVSTMDQKRAPRPHDRSGLLAFYDRASERLHRTLLDTPPETEVWMWADDHSAAYVARRQAHEALIHRLDAELTTGDRGPMDPSLCADGVDEALKIMRGVEQEDGLVLTTISDPVVISCSDVPGSWTVIPTHVTGNDGGGGGGGGGDGGDGGDSVDVARFVVRDGDDLTATATIRGTAADLDCWLWNRPPSGHLERDGDLAALGAVDRVLDASVD